MCKKQYFGNILSEKHKAQSCHKPVPSVRFIFLFWQTHTLPVINLKCLLVAQRPEKVGIILDRTDKMNQTQKY
jgi:hypothetical protein